MKSDNNFDSNMLGLDDCAPEYSPTFPVLSATVPVYQNGVQMDSLGDVQNEYSFFFNSTVFNETKIYSEPVSENISQNPYTLPTESVTSVARDVVGDLDLDDSLMKVALEAVNQGNLLPIIKEEIKTSIQSRRLASGRQELVLPQYAPVPEQLTEEDVRRRSERRLRNKSAAQRCRQRKKKQSDELSDEATDLESHNQILQDDITVLMAEKSKLTQMLANHMCNRKRARFDCESATSTFVDG